MMTFATAMKSMLVVAVVFTVSGHGSAAERPFECCTKVGQAEIKEPILGFYVQRRSQHCVPAIIFQTDRGYHCSSINENWVRSKINALREQKKASTTTSLLKLIASSSPPPSTAPTSSTSEKTTGIYSTRHTAQ